MRLKLTEWQLQQTLKVPPLAKAPPRVWTKKDYRQQLEQCRQHPLLLRLATDLWRRGVSRALFYEQLHLAEDRLSQQVADYLEDLWAERKFNPDLVPPFGPPALVTRQGAPTAAELKAVAHRLQQWLTAYGWPDTALHELGQQLNPAPLVLDGATCVAAEPEPELAPVVSRWSVWTGKEWWHTTVKRAATKRLKELQAEAAKVLAAHTPMPDFGQRRCRFCNRALHELTVVERNTRKLTVGCWHFNCWFLDHRLDHRLPDGLTLWHPLHAKTYRYSAATKTWSDLTTDLPVKSETGA